jgi:hypothetical protein
MSEISYVSTEEFDDRLQEYRKKNKIVDALLRQGGENWEKAIPAHLHRELFEKVGCKPDTKKY